MREWRTHLIVTLHTEYSVTDSQKCLIFSAVSLAEEGGRRAADDGGRTTWAQIPALLFTLMWLWLRYLPNLNLSFPFCQTKAMAIKSCCNKQIM